MLVDPLFGERDPIVMLMAAIVGGDMHTGPVRKVAGVYEINHFNGEHELNRADGWADGFDYQYPKLESKDQSYFGSYGVCDDYQQVLDQCPMLRESDREFVIFVTAVHKSDQYEEGGWRWHKWGEYIGALTPTCEYLYDEPEIRLVYVYHITERKKS